MGSIKNEMVNRVALAIAKASGINDWFKAADEYEEEARAAIEAMWEPTPDMIATAKQFSKPISEREIWQAMVSAALEGAGAAAEAAERKRG